MYVNVLAFFFFLGVTLFFSDSFRTIRVISVRVFSPSILAIRDECHTVVYTEKKEFVET